jgi:hypothetical protein
MIVQLEILNKSLIDNHESYISNVQCVSGNFLKSFSVNGPNLTCQGYAPFFSMTSRDDTPSSQVRPAVIRG